VRRQGSIVAALCAAAAAIALAVPTVASAVTFTVNTTKDGVDANIADATCAAAGGKCTLRAAIDEANDTAGGDDIQVPKGTFELKRAPTPSVSNAEGDLDITERVLIDGAGRGKTVVEQTVKDRVIWNTADGAFDDPPITILTDLTITGGRYPTPGAGLPGGGGILNDDGGLALQNVAVRGNLVTGPSGTARGGGIHQTAGTIDIENSTVRGNVARANIYPIAGGIYVSGGDSFIDLSRIAGNSTVRPDPVPGGFALGGGIAIGPGATSSIIQSTIAGNSGQEGGGLNSFQGTVDVIESTISGNEARNGGGIESIDANFNIRNSTLSGNSARQGGAAVRFGSGSTVDVVHVTIAGNTPVAGHAAVEAVTDTGANDVDFYGSIVANKGPECGGDVADLKFDDQNVLGGPSCSEGQISTDLVADPMLKPLDDYGGPTKTRALKAASPAIDFVNTGVSLPTDQRGEPREFQASDAGSFERQ
jgi:hypothetical protein